jgi:hypothetical protein
LIEFCTKLNDQTKIIGDDIELKEISKFLISFDNKIEGKFTKKEFLDASEKYININKREMKEYVEMNDCTKPEAMKYLQKQFYDQFYGNQNK